MGLEIERKFLVDQSAMPDLSEAAGTLIKQGYLAIGADSEARLRSENDYKYSLTVKTAGELIRGEFETTITRDQFTALWPATENKRIEKTRYLLHGMRNVELDIYRSSLQGLIVAEVEFPDELSAASYVPPLYCGTEVTADKRFKNQQLALNGLPPGIDQLRG